MSNINRLPDFIDDDDESDLSLKETNSELRALDEPTAVGQIVYDDRPTLTGEMSNGRINHLIIHLTRTLLTSSSDVEFAFPVGETRPWTEESIFNYILGTNHNGRLNGRITHPSDAFQAIFMNLLSPVLIRLIMFSVMSNGIPFGVQDTQAHTLVLPTINRPQTDVYVDNENGDYNEDATLFDDVVISSTVDEIEHDNPMTVRENMALETIDDQTNNDHMDIEHENEQSMEDDTTFEAESQTDLINENSERGEASPRSELDSNNEPDEHAQVNIPMTPSTSEIRSSAPAEEIVSSLAGPTDDNTQTTDDPAQLSASGLDVSRLNVQHRKESSALNVHEEVAGIKHTQ